MSSAHASHRGLIFTVNACPLAVLILATMAATPSVAAVTGSVHINSGYQRYSTSLVPDKVFNFTTPSNPALTLDFQQVFNNNAQPPEVVYYRSANAMADGSDGTLSAYANAELGGTRLIGRSLDLGIYAEANLYGTDYFTVSHGSRPNGSLVELVFDLDVHGNGHGEARYNVSSLTNNGGTIGQLSLSYSDPGDGNVRSRTHGSFMAVVGGLYEIDYSLLAFAYLSDFSRSPQYNHHLEFPSYSTSDFFHTANVYASPGASGAVLNFTSGHDYSLPSPVPEPASAALLLGGLALLTQRLRHRH